MEEQLKHAALEYHRFPTPGKISVVPTKQLFTQRDLALAYSPGVAYACKAIEAAGRDLDPVVAAEPGVDRCQRPRCQRIDFDPARRIVSIRATSRSSSQK